MTIKGLYALYYLPHAQGGAYMGKVENFESYSHDIASMGGFWGAQIVINLPMLRAEEWYELGIGRQIEIFDHRGVLVFKGFVNQVTLAAGSNTEIRGPLLNVKNRVSATYTPRDFSVYPPIDGSQTVTTITENTTSQGIYGIIETVLSVGATEDATAELARDRYLDEYSLPKSSGTLNISPGGGQNPSVTLDILGNVHWLMHYVYDNTSATTYSTISEKIQDILSYDPNNIISSDFSYIETNSYLVPDLEIKLRMAWDILIELISLGDGATDGRSIFGIYDKGNRAYYNAIPTTIEYEHKLSNERQIITSPGGQFIYLPWMIRPGNWINIPDFLIGRYTKSSSLKEDPRNKFLDNVKFTAPYTVDLSGGATDELSQMLTKITFSGGIY